VVIDAAKLPNPYTPINSKALDLSAPKIIDWMENKSPNTTAHMQAMVDRAKSAFSSQRSVRVQCYGGAHRSQALAWKILESMDRLTIADVQVVCLDCEPLPELASFVRASP
jgi:RNase adaptor protein for sRNA GlmZ degradation